MNEEAFQPRVREWQGYLNHAVKEPGKQLWDAYWSLEDNDKGKENGDKEGL